MNIVIEYVDYCHVSVAWLGCIWTVMEGGGGYSSGTKCFNSSLIFASGFLC